MKNIIRLLFFLIAYVLTAAAKINAQAPAQLNYQAIARNVSGSPLVNQSVKIRLKIHSGSAAGAVEYSESRTVTTNTFGLFTVAIGSAGAIETSGSMGTISWDNGEKFLQVELDATNGNNFLDMGTTQLLSVPYALNSADNYWVKSGNNISNKNSGMVGIAKANPEFRLDVNGSINTDSFYRLKGDTVLITDAMRYGVFVGNHAGSNNFATYNTFVGFGAGTETTYGAFNSFVGSQAGTHNTTGADNSFFGAQAGYSNTTGSYNSFFGQQSGRNNTIGIHNSFYGYGSGRDNTTGQMNTFSGYLAGTNNIAGSKNTFTGGLSGVDNLTADDNSFYGYLSGNRNTIGSSNSFFGTYAGQLNSTGFHNSFFGQKSGNQTTVGDSNSFFGYQSGLSNTTGTGNSFFGNEAGYSNTASDNSFFGNRAGFSNTIGWDNTFFGHLTGFANTIGVRNSFFGNTAGESNTSGYNNAFFGFSTGSNTTVGNANSFFGVRSGVDNTTGVGNSFFGYSAGRHIVGSNDNMIAGVYAGSGENGMGARNTIIGGYSGLSNFINSYNTFIGYGADAVPGNITFIDNGTAIGYLAKVTANNQVRIGNSNVTSIGGYAGWSNLSDGRFKKDLREDVPGLDFILKLRPVTYHLDLKKLDDHLQINDSISKSANYHSARVQKENLRQTGFVAQEVEKAAKELGFDFSGIDKPKYEGDVYSLRYADFTVPLVKAVQQLAKENEELKKELAEIKNSIQHTRSPGK